MVLFRKLSTAALMCTGLLLLCPEGIGIYQLSKQHRSSSIASFCKLLHVYRQLKLKSHLTWIITTSVTNQGSEHIVKHHSKRPPVTTGIIWLVFNYLKKSYNDNQDVVTVVSLGT